MDTASDMKEALLKETWDIILYDYSIPGFGAIPALALLKEMQIDLPVIIISGVIGEDTAVEAMRSGARDFIVKGKYARLLPAVRREVEEYIQLKAREAEVKKQKAEAVKQRQLAFTMIMQNPQPLLIIDTKFDIKLANEAFLSLSGYSEVQLQKMNIREFKILKKSGHNIKEALATKKKGVTGEVTVEFPKATHSLEQHTIPLLDKEGGIVSIMTVYNDLTGKLIEEAKREELANYITAYLSSMADNLTKLSTANLDFNLAIAPASKTTEEARQWFTGINKNLAEVKAALDLLVSDANTLTKTAVEGKLDTRADATKHQGDYRKIVEGFNSSLDYVINPVNEAMRIANHFSNCDFSARVDEKLHLEGDFIKFKDALNSIGIEISKAVNIINQQVMELASSAEEANASIEEISSGAEQIAKNAAGVSTNTEHGNEGISQVLRAMEDLNQTVTDVAQKAERVSQLTEDANQLSVKGTGLAEQAELGMRSITTSSNEVDKIIVDIKAEMDKIGKIVGLISDLANQTNLLALNAAIEAARAGEAGRGFAVVASEVKSLAQESRASAEKIADMIGTLQKKSLAAGEAIASSSREVKAGSEALSQTLHSFKDIAKSIEDISRNVVEVASVSEEQAATVEEVTASVTEVHGMVQATAKDAMDAAAASEEASASIDQITRVIGSVNAIVDNVSKEMAKFKV